MSKLLHVSASPRGPRSESLAIAGTFIETFGAANPAVPVETFDLWDGSLPAFGPDAAAAKMAVFAGQEPTGDGWARAVETFQRFDDADLYLFSVPMWNHGVPYILKQFIDVVSQPGLVFGFDPAAGYTGLLTGKRAAVIYTSAVYGPGLPPSFGADFQATYLTDWLRWAGVTDISEIHFRPNLVTADAAAARESAHADAREAAKRMIGG
ncbi:NAD(P)H-dependent oxidoreductase [Actinoplanes sp. NPDC051470]|uniref:FMN-dependent NADH-azoreductase n=1 Tax=Actinoplanes sp. NPDC051470 TaxID=3157224 RepID=UPI00343A2E2D